MSGRTEGGDQAEGSDEGQTDADGDEEGESEGVETAQSEEGEAASPPPSAEGLRREYPRSLLPRDADPGRP